MSHMDHRNVVNNSRYQERRVKNKERVRLEFVNCDERRLENGGGGVAARGRGLSITKKT